MDMSTHPFLHEPSDVLWTRCCSPTINPLREVFIHRGCSTMAICWMAEDLAAYFTHDLWGSILDKGNLIKMLPTFRLALILKDIPLHLTSKLCLQPPYDGFGIHHLCPENVIFLFLWANAFKSVGDGGRYQRLGKFSDGCRSRCLLAIWSTRNQWLWTVRWEKRKTP